MEIIDIKRVSTIEGNRVKDGYQVVVLGECSASQFTYYTYRRLVSVPGTTRLRYVVWLQGNILANFNHLHQAISWIEQDSEGDNEQPL